MSHPDDMGIGVNSNEGGTIFSQNWGCGGGGYPRFGQNLKRGSHFYPLRENMF